MIVIDIPANPNCDTVDMRLFQEHRAQLPRPVTQVRLERTAGTADWYDIVGWTAQGVACDALAQWVDDSGDGVALLVYGGDAGLRLRPAGATTSWRLGHPQQWGEAFLIMGDARDVRLEPSGAVHG